MFVSIAFGFLALTSSIKLLVTQDIPFNDRNSNNIISNVNLDYFISKHEGNDIEFQGVKTFSNLSSTDGVTIEKKKVNNDYLEMEDYDMEEIRRLGDKIEQLSSQIHSNQLDNVTAVSELTSEIKILTHKIEDVSMHIEKLPETVKEEIKKIDFDKKNDTKKTWIAPIVIGLVLLGAQIIISIYF